MYIQATKHRHQDHKHFNYKVLSINTAHHNTQKHHVSGSFWATHDERVSRSRMHYSSLTYVPTLLVQYSN